MLESRGRAGRTAGGHGGHSGGHSRDGGDGAAQYVHVHDPERDSLELQVMGGQGSGLGTRRTRADAATTSREAQAEGDALGTQMGREAQPDGDGADIALRELHSSMTKAEEPVAAAASPSRHAVSAQQPNNTATVTATRDLNVNDNAVPHNPHPLARERPTSANSLPLQRVASHGRDSILEMDLADAAYEPTSAANMQAGQLSLASRGRRGRHRRKHHRHAAHRYPHLRRSPSVSSRLTKKTVRSRAEDAIKHIRRRTRRNSASWSSSSSSSSSSTSSTSSSGSSSSSGIGWRFWRSSTASSVSDDSYIPPEPTFTLYTPRLSYALQAALDGRAQEQKQGTGLDRTRSRTVPHPYTSKSSEQREGDGFAGTAPHLHPPGMAAAPQVFETTPSRTLTPCLDRLREFWQERDQQESLGGDIGAAHASAASSDSPASAKMPARSGSDGAEMPEPPTTKPATDRKTRNAGPAWWLDVQCPSIQDMRQLRRLIPLHPLTIEDILGQETREKIEVYDHLGYYFVSFRALDETYFRYSEGASASSASTRSGSSSADIAKRVPGAEGLDEGHHGLTGVIAGDMRSSLEKRRSPSGSNEKVGLDDRISVSSAPAPGSAGHDGIREGSDGARRKGKVEIVEGPKEGVEGVGVGAVNVYMVVFGDGVISFHFEDIDKHITRVRDRIQQYGIARNISSHWIAYGLMDSIVDTFFPLIDFIESESDDIDEFLANPLFDPRRVQPDPAKAPALEPLSSTSSGNPVSEVKNIQPSHLFRLRLPTLVKTRSLAQMYGSVKSATVPSQREATLSKFGRGLPSSAHAHAKRDPLAPRTMSKKSLKGVDDKLYDRGKMLKRIAMSRKLIMGLSRLLIPKTDVVRGLRKRIRDEALSLGNAEPGQRHDINIYLGDLQDHIITMQQTLHFFDTMLSHDHPAYLGVLRLAYEAAKIGNDKAIVRLYIVTLVFLPINIFCGVFGTNVKVPHNGTNEDHTVNSDGSPAAYYVFGIVLVGVLIIIALVIGVVAWIFKASRKSFENGGAKRL